MSEGGKTISFSIAVSIVIGWPSSSISSISYTGLSVCTVQDGREVAYHIDYIKVILYRDFRYIPQVVFQSSQETF